MVNDDKLNNNDDPETIQKHFPNATLNLSLNPFFKFKSDIDNEAVDSSNQNQEEGESNFKGKLISES